MRANEACFSGLADTGHESLTTTNYHTDALGSVRQFTDKRGSVSGYMDYTPFGEETKSFGSLPFMGFTGEPQELAGKSDLLYLRSRYYHPGLGCFLTQDSMVPDAANRQAWNAYAYVYNDPVNLVDPSGHHPIIIAIGVGAAVNIAVEYASQVQSNWADCISGVDAFIDNLNGRRVITAGLAGGVSGAVGFWIGGMPTAGLRIVAVAGANPFVSGFQRILNGEGAIYSDPRQSIL